MPEGGAGAADGGAGGADGPATTPSQPPAAASEQGWTKERAREVLAASGLAQPPPRSDGPRRLVLFAVVILLVLVLIVVASLIALNHLQHTVTTTTTQPTIPSSTSTTAPTTATTSGPGTGSAPSTAAALATFAAGSQSPPVQRQVGTGGQPLGFERTAAPTYVTDPHRRPVVVYWWNGTCAPCAAENLIVVSSLEALGGTFHGLSATDEPGPTATIDLRHGTYDGPVVLEASEVDGTNGRPDQRPSAQAVQQFTTYDGRPYTPFADSYPFLDVAGHFVMVGPGFSPALLAGKSLTAVADGLAQPDAVVTRAVLGNANELTAAICVTLGELSQRLPAACSNPAIVSIETTLPAVAPHGAKG